MHRVLAVLAGSACIARDLDGDGVPATRDCNDGDPRQLLPVELFVDADGDGFGGPTTALGCAGNSWLAETSEDCDDSDADVFPGAREVGCDGRDNDCNPVTPDGPAWTVGATWNRVADAVDRVGFNETVFLCGSTIRESFTTWRPATIQGAGSGRTILDGSDGDRSTIEVRAPLILIGVTVQSGAGSPSPAGGDTRYGGGISAFDVESLVLQDVRLTRNQADAGGGLAVIGPTRVQASDLRIDGNRAGLGGGLWLQGLQETTLDDSRVVGNQADVGGGVWLDGTLAGDDLRIVDNRALVGGGVHLEPEAFLNGPGLAIVHNTATAAGGGAEGAGTLADLTIARNGADTGGGVHVSGTMTLQGVELRGNLAARGAGLFCDGCTLDGTAVELRGGSASVAGGGLSVRCGAASLADVVLADNTAPDGAALHLDGGLAALLQATSTANVAVVPGATFSLRQDCASAFLVVEGLIADAADRVAVGAVPAAPLPGGTFTCVASEKGEGCAVP